MQENINIDSNTHVWARVIPAYIIINMEYILYAYFPFEFYIIYIRLTSSALTESTYVAS